MPCLWSYKINRTQISMTVKATTVASITLIKVSETKLQNASKYFKFSNASFSQTNEILQYYLHKATWLVHVSQSSYAWKTREVNKEYISSHSSTMILVGFFNYSHSSFLKNMTEKLGTFR